MLTARTRRREDIGSAFGRRVSITVIATWIIELLLSYTSTGTQINLQDYPALDRIPPLNSAKVRQWVSEVEAKGAIPSVPLTGLNGCSNSTFNAQVGL